MLPLVFTAIIVRYVVILNIMRENFFILNIYIYARPCLVA